MTANRTISAASCAASIEDTAASWLVRRNGGLAPEENLKFEAWLAADARHRAAWAEMEAAWAALSFPGQRGRGDEAKRALAARVARRGRRRWAMAGAALLFVVVGLVSFRSGRIASAPLNVAGSVTVRPDTQTLPDGSTVELNAGAEILVEFSPEVRAVRLVRGEALFAVAKNPARPFVVSAGAVSVRAVGTAFAVRQGEAEVGVLVTEGKVAVERAGSAGRVGNPAVEPIFVTAGGRVAMPADATPTPPINVTTLSAGEIAEALAWRGRRVEFTRTTLAEAVALLNRQNDVQIVIADAAAARLAISGIFWADDPESLGRLLESGFGLEATRTDRTITLRAR